MNLTQKITPCIWYNHTAEEAANFYATLLPDSRVVNVQRSPAKTPSQEVGDVLVVEFELAGTRYVGLNGGPIFPQTEAVSFMIRTEDQTETDRLWNAIVGNGGAESMCGWCKDKWGVNWQITPQRLLDLAYGEDQEAGRRVMEAMMTMRKIDIATLEAAYKGETVQA
jgi:predicted 3-demethylubiquinone-9 3-methyltransferase (glyoxalase superfamily)